MGPPSYTRSVVDRNVVMWRIPVCVFRTNLRTKGDLCSIQVVGYFTKEMCCSLCGTDWNRSEFIQAFGWPVSYDSCGWRRRSQLLRGLRRRSAAARLLGLRVRIPPRAWLSVSFERCVSSGRGLCDEPIPRPEEYYRMCVCVCVCECEWMSPSARITLNTYNE